MDIDMITATEVDQTMTSKSFKSESPVEIEIGKEKQSFDDVQDLVDFLTENPIYAVGQLRVRQDTEDGVEFYSMTIDLSPGETSIEEKLIQALAEASKGLKSVSKMEGLVIHRGKLH